VLRRHTAAQGQIASFQLAIAFFSSSVLLSDFSAFRAAPIAWRAAVVPARGS